MSKKVPQPVYGLKGGTKDFNARELADHHRHKMNDEHEQQAKEANHC